MAQANGWLLYVPLIGIVTTLLSTVILYFMHRIREERKQEFSAIREALHEHRAEATAHMDRISSQVESSREQQAQMNREIHGRVDDHLRWHSQVKPS